MIHEVVRKGIDQIPTDGLERLKEHIGGGGEVLLDGRIYDGFASFG